MQVDSEEIPKFEALKPSEMNVNTLNDIVFKVFFPSNPYPTSQDDTFKEGVAEGLYTDS